MAQIASMANSSLRPIRRAWISSAPPWVSKTTWTNCSAAEGSGTIIVSSDFEDFRPVGHQHPAIHLIVLADEFLQGGHIFLKITGTHNRLRLRPRIELKVLSSPFCGRVPKGCACFRGVCKSGLVRSGGRMRPWRHETRAKPKPREPSPAKYLLLLLPATFGFRIHFAPLASYV